MICVGSAVNVQIDGSPVSGVVTMMNLSPDGCLAYHVLFNNDVKAWVSADSVSVQQ